MSTSTENRVCQVGEFIVQVTRIGEGRDSMVEEMPPIADVVHFVMVKGDADALKELLAVGSLDWMKAMDVAPSSPGCMVVFTNSEKYHFFPGQVFDVAIGPIKTADLPPQSSSWQQGLKVGSKVWWNDPDKGILSGTFEISEIRSDGEVKDDTVIVIQHKGGMAEVFLSELSPWVCGDGQGSECLEANPVPARVDVQHWAHERYTGGVGLFPVTGETFQMELEDHRSTSGQLWVTTAPVEGMIDQMLSICMEVGHLSTDSGDFPAANIYFDSDNMAATLYRVNDTVVMRLAEGVQLRSEVLDDGSTVFVLK